MMINEKKIVEYNFDRMRETISNTWLPIKDGANIVGETRLGTDDVFRIATALINEGFRLELEVTTEPVHWTIETDEEEPNPMFKHVICSACGKTANEPYKYCPECGAKMRGIET